MAMTHEKISLIFLLGFVFGQCSASPWDCKVCIKTVENSEGPTLESLVAPSYLVVLPTQHRARLQLFPYS